MDQRVGVDALERARGRHHLLHPAPDRLRAGDDEDGPQALAAREHAVAHGLVDRRRGVVLAGKRGVERAINRRPALGQVGGQIERAHRSSSGSIANGWVFSSPASSLSRSSTRRSASSRYFAQWRASAMPSSNALSEASSGRLPDSSAPTIFSRRARPASKLRAGLTLPPLLDRAIQRPP